MATATALRAPLTHERLRARLHYDPLTGVFTWLPYKGRAGCIKAGDHPGSPDMTGHLRIQLDGVMYYSHRLAWFYMTGAWPVHEIDHWDTDPGNNAWTNLRDITHQRNTENRRVATRSKKNGLPIGVSVDSRDGAIRADITVDGRQISLGRYATVEGAHAAYVQAKRELHAGSTL